MSVFVKYTTGKNLLDKEPIITGNKPPKIIGITEQQYYEYEKQKIEIDKYKSKIYKAIEYMEESMNNPLKYEWGVLKHTLEILKGK